MTASQTFLVSQAAGALQVNGALTFGKSNLTLTVDGPGSTTLAGGISQAGGTTGGSLLKQGTGTLTLSSTNTYTGNTTVNAGTRAPAPCPAAAAPASRARTRSAAAA